MRNKAAGHGKVIGKTLRVSVWSKRCSLPGAVTGEQDSARQHSHSFIHCRKRSHLNPLKHFPWSPHTTCTLRKILPQLNLGYYFICLTILLSHCEIMIFSINYFDLTNFEFGAPQRCSKFMASRACDLLPSVALSVKAAQASLLFYQPTKTVMQLQDAHRNRAFWRLVFLFVVRLSRCEPFAGGIGDPQRLYLAVGGAN